MTGLLQAIMSIPWSEVLTGMSASCVALIVPALLAQLPAEAPVPVGLGMKAGSPAGDDGIDS
jgi:hypothetical protein